MEIVKQQKPYDCGVPCIAMLAGINYTRAWKIAEPYMSDTEGRIPFQNFQPIFHKLNFTTNTFSSLPKNHKNNGICEITYMRNGKQNWHYIVWDATKQIFLDPNKSPNKEFTIIGFTEVIPQ